MLLSFMSFKTILGNIKTMQHVPTKIPQTSNVNKRTLIYNALLKPKPDDFGNALYNYGCFIDRDEIIQNIRCFSPCEKHYVIQKLDETGKLKVKNDWIMQTGWGETKTDIEESSGDEPNAHIRNKLLDPLYFNANELANLEKELERFKVFLSGCNNRHKNTWIRQRAPIFQNMLKIFDEFSHVELIVLYDHLRAREEEILTNDLNTINL